MIGPAGPRQRRLRMAALVAAASLFAEGRAAGAGDPVAGAPAPAPEELELIARSLRSEGRAELEAQAGPLGQLPLSEVEAEVDPSGARVDGHLRLLFTNRERAPIAELVLRLYPSAPSLRAGTSLRASELQLDGAPATGRTRGSVLEVPLARPLAPGQRVALALAFHGKLRRLAPGEDDLAQAALQALGIGRRGGATGLHGTSAGYGTFAASDAGAVLVDWYPQLAARAGGRWDRQEPGPLGDAARADPSAALVTLTMPRGHRAIGAGVALGQHALESGKEVATFAMAGLRGALGLAVLRGAAEATADVALPALSGGAGPGKAALPGAGVHLRAASLHGQAGAEALLSCARDALRELSRRFGPYPWSDLALAEVPLTGGAGGVELPGLALVARGLAGEGSVAPAGMLEFTCHHEVAHQWFPAVVGSDPRGAPWVDEALAQHSAVLVAEAVAGGGAGGREVAARSQARFVTLNYQGMRMLGGKDGKVARGADSFRDPVAYAGLVYGKAPLFFARVRDLVGDARHDLALRGLRARYAFREAPGTAVLEAFTAQDPAHQPQLQALERRWLREAHGDEDLPPLDPMALLQTMGGGGAVNGALGEAALQQALRELDKSAPGLRRMLEELLQQLQRQVRPGADGGDDDEGDEP